MGERKVLNKYFPPDFDPSKLPRGKRVRTEETQMKVRMMLPMSVRCNTCGNFMYKGTKFNTRMEDVKGENYLGIKIFRFYYKCTNCGAEFCMKTDPKSTDYIVEAGATRNYEPWRDNEQSAAEAAAKKEEEEKGNAMKVLENRTLDSKREMDILNALDEMKSLKARHEMIDTETALAALRRAAGNEANEADLDAEDEEAVRQMLLQRAGFVKRLPSGSSDSLSGSKSINPLESQLEGKDDDGMEQSRDKSKEEREKGKKKKGKMRGGVLGHLSTAAALWQEEEGEELDGEELEEAEMVATEENGKNNAARAARQADVLVDGSDKHFAVGTAIQNEMEVIKNERKGDSVDNQIKSKTNNNPMDAKGMKSFSSSVQIGFSSHGHRAIAAKIVTNKKAVQKEATKQSEVMEVVEKEVDESGLAGLMAGYDSE